ncbi:MAG: rhamnulokinase [Clostridia bacterium]|nr:rhamnulokinase [Clostridia bacterium]
MKYCLAIDMGASSGRHILGFIEDGKLKLEEIYRFENGIIDIDGTLCWDINKLFEEIKNGLKECKKLGKIPETVAIDTWGVDYVLLDKDKKEILPAVAYRDPRTLQIPEEIDKIIPRKELYERTGIQATNYNSIYQLYCDKKSGKLQNAAYFLMMPEYFSFKLTGEIRNEYTLSTTGGLVNTKTFERDEEILEKLGIPEKIFTPLSLPGTVVGNLSDEVKEELGFDTTVILCASHDTASAVASCSVGDNGIYISSGTWSLIGTENAQPVTCEKAMESGFTNEGGIEHRYRFLENIMGMWLFQNIRKNLDKKYTYDEMMQMAMESDFTEYINPNAEEFLAPENMVEAIRNYLNKPELPIGDVLNSVYHSLAKTYNEAVKVVEEISNKQVDVINIVGGGCKDSYLNSLTEKYTGKKVIAGPVEATAAGNLMVQLMYLDKGLDLISARELIKNSFSKN